LESEDVAPLADIAFTLAVGRRGHEYRIAVLGTEHSALADSLRAAEVPNQPGTAEISFVFSEEIPNAVELGQRWSEQETAFAVHWRAIWNAGARELSQAGAVFALQYALGRTWLSWGLKPAAIHGDGVAALAAACVAETLSLAEALSQLRSGNYEPPHNPTQDIPTCSTEEETLGIALRVEDGLQQAVARAWANGVHVNWNTWFANEARGRVPLPGYPFEGREGGVGDGEPE
jgi:polyketide synthase PksN